MEDEDVFINEYREEYAHFASQFEVDIQRGIRVSANMLVEYLRGLKLNGEDKYIDLISQLFKGSVPECFFEGIVIDSQNLENTLVEVQGQIILFLELKNQSRLDDKEFSNLDVAVINSLFEVFGTAVSADIDYYNEFCKDIYTLYKQDLPWTIYQIFLIIERCPPKEFCDQLKVKCHHFKLQLKKKYLNNSIGQQDLFLDNNFQASPFEILKKPLENINFNSNLLNGPLQERLEQIDKKCTEKEKLFLEKSKLMLSLQSIPTSKKTPSKSKPKLSSLVTTDYKEEANKEVTEVQRIVNLVSKMAHRGGRQASCNRLTSFPTNTLPVPSSLKTPSSPKRKRDPAESLITLKRIRDDKFIPQDKQLKKKTPFVLPKTYLRLVT